MNMRDVPFDNDKHDFTIPPFLCHTLAPFKTTQPLEPKMYYLKPNNLGQIIVVLVSRVQYLSQKCKKKKIQF